MKTAARVRKLAKERSMIDWLYGNHYKKLEKRTGGRKSWPHQDMRDISIFMEIMPAL